MTSPVFQRRRPWWHSAKMLRCFACRTAIRWTTKEEWHKVRRTLCDDCQSHALPHGERTPKVS